MKTLSQMFIELAALEAEASEWASDAGSVEGNRQAADLYAAAAGLQMALSALERLGAKPTPKAPEPLRISRHLGWKKDALELNDLCLCSRDLDEMLQSAQRITIQPELIRHTCRRAAEAVGPGYMAPDWMSLSGPKLLDEASKLREFVLDELAAQAEIHRAERMAPKYPSDKLPPAIPLAAMDLAVNDRL